MTQAFEDDGTLVSVTVIEVEPNLITAVRSCGRGRLRGRSGRFRDRAFTKGQQGPGGRLREARNAATPASAKSLRGVTGEVGESLGADVFEAGDKVHVTSTSKGKGFQGTIKRHNFARGPVSHGSHNVRRARFSWRFGGPGPYLQGPEDARTDGQRVTSRLRTCA